MSEIWAYTDGACSGNPGPGGWATVLCVYPIDRPRGEAVVCELAGAEPATTNNRMEMRAALEAIIAVKQRFAPASGKATLKLFTDSSLLIQGITQWIHGWKKRGWKKADGKDVLNQDLWESLSKAVDECPAKIEWLYVPGHAGVEGNERVDVLAVELSKKRPIDLYEGNLTNYPHREAFGKFPPVEAVRSSSTKASAGSAPSGPKSAKGPVFYLSLVRGQLERHSTWSDCERRVKGVAGAKFKKVSSLAEESATLKGWGL